MSEAGNAVEMIEGSEGAQSSTNDSSMSPAENRPRYRRVCQCRICKRNMDYDIYIIHMKKFHNIEVPQQRRVRKCRICKRFMDYDVLIVHMRKFHNVEIADEEPTISKVEPPIELPPLKRKHRREVKIPYSREPAKKSKTQITTESIAEKIDLDMKCPLCDKRYSDHENLAKHCELDHGYKDCVVEMRTFQSASECEKWKEVIAKTHRTVWVINEGYRSSARNVLYYQCSRCEPGTLPYCTSFLKEFVYEDGTILVKYCTRHITHRLSVPKLPLSKADEDIVAGYLRQNIEIDAIRNTIQKKYTDPNDRLHWISCDDIKNVADNLQFEKNLEDTLSSSPSPSSSEISSDDEKPVDLAFEETPISATALLEQSSKCEHEQAARNGDSAEVQPTTSAAVPAEALIVKRSECPSCKKLSKKVAELEALVKRLNEKVMELDGPQLFSSAMKEEGK